MPKKSDDVQKKPRKRSSRYSKTKGSSYERQIAKELRDLGYSGIVTARSESKSTDDKKIDLIDTEDKLGFYAQLKKTQNIPSYFKIESECPLKDKPFVIFWAAQSKKAVNICTQGELVILPKEYFYELIKIKE